MKRIIVSVLFTLLMVVYAAPVTAYAKSWTKEDEKACDELFEQLMSWDKNNFDCDEYYVKEKKIRMEIAKNPYAQAELSEWGEAYSYVPFYIHADLDSEWLKNGNSSPVTIVFKWNFDRMYYPDSSEEAMEDLRNVLKERYNVPEGDNGVYFQTQVTFENDYSRIVNVPIYCNEISEIYCDDLELTQLYMNGEVSEMDDLEVCMGNFVVATLEFSLGEPSDDGKFVSKYGTFNYYDALSKSIDKEKFPEIRQNKYDSFTEGDNIFACLPSWAYGVAGAIIILGAVLFVKTLRKKHRMKG